MGKYALTSRKWWNLGVEKLLGGKQRWLYVEIPLGLQAQWYYESHEHRFNWLKMSPVAIRIWNSSLHTILKKKQRLFLNKQTFEHLRMSLSKQKWKRKWGASAYVSICSIDIVWCLEQRQLWTTKKHLNLEALGFSFQKDDEKDSILPPDKTSIWHNPHRIHGTGMNLTVDSLYENLSSKCKWIYEKIFVFIYQVDASEYTKKYTSHMKPLVKQPCNNRLGHMFVFLNFGIRLGHARPLHGSWCASDGSCYLAFQHRRATGLQNKMPLFKPWGTWFFWGSCLHRFFKVS